MMPEILTAEFREYASRSIPSSRKSPCCSSFSSFTEEVSLFGRVCRAVLETRVGAKREGACTVQIRRKEGKAERLGPSTSFGQADEVRNAGCQKIATVSFSSAFSSFLLLNVKRRKRGSLLRGRVNFVSAGCFNGAGRAFLQAAFPRLGAEGFSSK